MGVNNPYSIKFNGSNSIVTFNDKLTNSGAKTIRFKIKTSVIPTGYGTIMANKSGSSERGITFRINNTGRLNIYLANGSGASVVLFNFNSTKIVCDGEWHDIALVWDGTTNVNSVKLFIDDMNNADATTTSTATDGIPTRNMEFGKNPNYTTSYYSGLLDEVEFWNRALSSNELEENKNQPILKIVNGLTNHYRFNENGLILDSVGGINGVASNIEWSEDTVDLGFNKILLLSNDGEVNSLKEGIFTEKLTPNMTSNTTPNGVVSASSILSSKYPPYLSFDGKKPTNSAAWATPIGTTSGWLQYEFQNNTKVNKYILGFYASGDDKSAPRNWTFESSNDGLNWNVLDVQSNVSWNLGVEKEFIFNNNNLYKMYRINISSNNGGTYLTIGEIELYGRSDSSIIKMPKANDFNFINYGMNSPVNVDGIFSSKNYILSNELENADGLWTTKINRKPLSIKFK